MNTISEMLTMFADKPCVSAWVGSEGHDYNGNPVVKIVAHFRFGNHGVSVIGVNREKPNSLIDADEKTFEVAQLWFNSEDNEDVELAYGLVQAENGYDGAWTYQTYAQVCEIMHRVEKLAQVAS